MASIVILLCLPVVFATVEWTVHDYNTTVTDESLNIYQNPLFHLEVVGSDDDPVTYMVIEKTITEQDNLFMDIVMTRFDGVMFPLPQTPIKLCELLSKESENNVNNTLTQFHLSSIFNLEGTMCPIAAGRKRLMPYMSPPRLRLQNDIGCGTFTCEATIESCQGQEPKNCSSFITASIVVFLSGDHCSNTLM